MNSFDGELRSLFERATSGVEPTVASRARVLRRARRRRIANSVVVGAAAMAVVFSAVFMSRGVFAASDSSTAPAGETPEIDVPDGEIEIASGSSAGVEWVLSAQPRERCVSLTTSGYAADTCAGPERPLNMHEIPLDADVLVFGDVLSEVSSVEVNVHYAKVAEGWTAELLAAPSNLETDRRYFVSSVPSDALLATVVAESPQDSVAEQVPSLGPGAVDGLLKAQGIDVCTSTITTPEEDLEAEARVLVKKISKAADGADAGAGRPEMGRQQFESYEGTVESCDKLFVPPRFSPATTSSTRGSGSRKG